MLKALGVQMSKKLKECLVYLIATDSFDDLYLEPIKSKTDFHELKGDRSGEFAMSLSGNHRLILTKNELDNTLVIVLEIGTDYH
jgi:plasmid maintenance system killer protein